MANPFQHPGCEVNSEERKIYWLASYPKSGNTWVRMFLNAYATHFPVDLNSSFQFVMSDLRPEIYQMMSPRPLQEMSIREQFMYHQGALINLLKLANTKNIYVKTHNAKAKIDEVPLIPVAISANAVYLIRDPRDVVISHAEHFNTTIDKSIEQLNSTDRAGKANFNLYHMFMSWSNHVESWCIKNREIKTLVVKYEDMLTNAEKAFKAILTQFDLGFDPERFKFALEQSNFKNLSQKEGETGFVEKASGDKFFRKGKAGQWKSILSKGQIDQIESDHGKVMKTYGYI